MKPSEFVAILIILSAVGCRSAVNSEMTGNPRTPHDRVGAGEYEPGTLVMIQGLRLVGGNSSREGGVEVQVWGEWGAVCDADWRTVDAKVSCRSLGLTGGRTKPASDFRHVGMDRVHVTNVSCSGEEELLALCLLLNQTTRCSLSDRVGVACDSGNLPAPLTFLSSRSRGELQPRSMKRYTNNSDLSHRETRIKSSQLQSTLPSAHLPFPHRTPTPLPSPVRVPFPRLSENVTEENVGSEQKTAMTSSVFHADKVLLNARSAYNLSTMPGKERPRDTAAVPPPTESEGQLLPGRSKRHVTIPSREGPSQQRRQFPHFMRQELGDNFSDIEENNPPSTNKTNDHQATTSEPPSLLMIIGIVLAAVLVAAGCILGAWWYQLRLGVKDKETKAPVPPPTPSKSILKKVSTYANPEWSELTEDEPSVSGQRLSDGSTTTSVFSASSTSSADTVLTDEPHKDLVSVEAML